MQFTCLMILLGGESTKAMISFKHGMITKFCMVFLFMVSVSLLGEFLRMQDANNGIGKDCSIEIVDEEVGWKS